MLDAEALAAMLAPIISEEVEKAVTPLNARIAELEGRQLEQGPPGEKGEPGLDGMSPDPEAVIASLLPATEQLVADHVAKAVAALPAPEKGEKGDVGESVDPELVEQLVADQVSKAVEALPAPKDGADGRGVKELLIDRDGNLVASMDDGELKSLGPVIGKDGEPGMDGRDGFDLTSFDAEVLDDDRTVQLKFVSGEHEHIVNLKWPTMIDRGVYKAGEEYDAGDAVSWGGSLWIAQKATDAKPDTPDSGWRLAVKRGRDGKDAKVG